MEWDLIVHVTWNLEEWENCMLDGKFGTRGLWIGDEVLEMWDKLYMLNGEFGYWDQTVWCMNFGKVGSNCMCWKKFWRRKICVC